MTLTSPSRLFDGGSSEYMSYSGTPGISAFPFSCAAWVYDYDILSGGTYIQVARLQSSGRVLMAMGYHIAENTVGLWGNSNNGWWQTYQDGYNKIIPPSGQWMHFAGVRLSQTDARFYLNGQWIQHSEHTDPETFDHNGLSLGAGLRDTAGGYMTGELWGVGIYSGALSPFDIQRLASGPVDPRTVRPDILNSLWYVDGTDNDVMGSRDLTATGTPGWGGTPSVPFSDLPRVGSYYPSAAEEAGALAYTQEGYRWRDDDNTEALASWLVAQDTTTSIPREENIRLRVLTDVTSDPGNVTRTLQYRKVGDTDWNTIT